MADTAPDMESALLARVRRRAPNTPTLPTASFHPDPTALESWRAVARSSWLNVFLVFIPISWAAATFAPGDHTLVFTTSFLAIIPLAQVCPCFIWRNAIRLLTRRAAARLRDRGALPACGTDARWIA